MMNTDASYSIEPLGKERLIISGLVNMENVVDFVTELTGQPYALGQDLILDMAEVFFEDGMSILLAINTFRSLASRVNSLGLHYPSDALFDGIQGNGLTNTPGLAVNVVRESSKMATAAAD
jgi:hypothetical protein